MAKKWLLRFGSSVLALALITGCTQADDPVEEEVPMNQQGENEGNTPPNDGADEGHQQPNE